MLEYENEILLDSLEESRLFIFAKGIAVHKVIQNLFRVYGTDCNLVFVLSASPAEESYFLNRNDKTRIFSITTEFTSSDRKSMYASGGVFFITARILVVDFLKEVVPADKITGIIVFRAHNVVESSQEAFILRLYRTKNKTGFIKCFSHSPTSFLLGFSRVSSVMRSCFLSKLSLWPRFHATVKESLKYTQAAASDDDEGVIEIQLRLTEDMRQIQSSLMDLVSSTVSELKRLVPALNDEDVSAETALTKGFEKILGAHVDPIWNTIDKKSKEILSDLKIFRLLLAQLTKSDCVTFYATLFTYMAPDAVLRSGSDWVMSKSAEKILTAAKRRLKPKASSKNSSSKSTTSDETTESTASKNPDFDPEVHPKWLAIGEILEEINRKLAEIPESDCCFSKSKTVIFAEDSKTCSAIRDYLARGTILTLAKIARNCENVKIDIPAEILSQLNSISRNERPDPAIVGSSRSNSSKSGVAEAFGDVDLPAENSDHGPNEVQLTLTQIQRKYEDVEFVQSPVVVLPLKNYGDAEAYGIPEILEKFTPDNIIVFDPDLELIRNIEIHRARMGTSQTIRIYFLVFRNSIEEQLYLTGIAREKMAFEKLIEEKANMVIPAEREGKDELNQDLWRDPTKASQSTAASASGLSRRNMENAESVQEMVLVDMREFRSELPSLIHKRGIDLEPLTLDVGDYILTPDVCVERKSISDLIGSLNSGRLYKQAEAMGRHYKKPVLLIEHEQKGGRYKNDLVQIMPKLQLLTINFPKLRIIWSPGAHYTSEIFHELKRGKAQPEASAALAIMKDEAGSHTTSKFNPISHAFISKLPGIDCKNVYTILNRVASLDELCSLSLEELTKILENTSAATVLHSGIHSKLVENEQKLSGPSKFFKSKSSKK